MKQRRERRLDEEHAEVRHDAPPPLPAGLSNAAMAAFARSGSAVPTGGAHPVMRSLARTPLKPATDWNADVGEFGALGSPFGFPARQDADPDMAPVDWMSLALPLPGPEDPPELRIPHGSHTPEAPPRERKQQGYGHPSHHQRPSVDWDRIENDLKDADRTIAWDAWEEKIDELETSWNGMRNDVKLFNDATQDPTLAEVHAFQPQKAGSLSQVAEAQVVPRTSKGGLTVGKLFGGGNVASTEGLSDNIAKAGRSDTVGIDLEKIRAEDAAVKATLIELATAQDLAAGTGDAVLGARAALDEDKAEDDKEAAEANKASIESEMEDVKFWVGISLDVISTGAAVMGSFAGSAAKTAGAAGGSGKKGRKRRKAAPAAEEQGGGLAGTVKEAVANDLVSAIAEGVVSWIYKDELAAAQKEIDAAVARMEEAHKRKLDADLREALNNHKAALKKIQSEGERVKEALARRRAAYLTLAKSASSAGGGRTSERDRLAGLVAAIPVVDTAIGACHAVLTKLVVPAYTEESAKGFGMAIYHRFQQTTPFLQHVAMLRGYKLDLEGELQRWTARRESLRTVITELEKVPGKQP